MHIKRHLTGLLTCLAAAALLGACGDEAEQLSCGPGTEAKDGQCALTDDGCADGTTLADDGTCVAEVVCGAGTEAQDGQCVVSEPTSCGPNTERDANSGECVVTDAACTEGTAYDADTDSCLPTDQVCADGTTWSEDSVMCMPDAQCQPGDIILGGLCATPAEELAESADFTEAELHTDGADIELKSAGEQFVFAGTIAAPADFDADEASTIDQDKDVYRFEADAGTWLEIALQSTGLPSPGFKLESADGSYERYSPFDTAAARQILLPKTGSYVLTILPTLVLESDGTIGPMGADDWSYVGTVEKIVPSTTIGQGELMSTGLTGDFTGLADNFFEVTDLPNDGLVHLEFDQLSADFDAELIVWGDDANAFYNFPVSDTGQAYIKVPDASTVRVLVDYVRKRGHHEAFATGVATEIWAEPAGMVAAGSANTTATTTVEYGDTIYVTFRAEPGQFIEVGHDNAESMRANMTLYTSDGTMLVEETVVDSASAEYGNTRELYHYSTSHNYYLLEVSGAYGADLTDLTVTAGSANPVDLGEVAVGDTVSHTNAKAARGFLQWGFIDVAERATLKLGVSTVEGDVSVYLYTKDMARFATMGDGDKEVVEPGSYFFAVNAKSATVGASDYEISLEALLPPVEEQEPNETTGKATSVDLGRDLVGHLSGSDVDTFALDFPRDMTSDEVFLFTLDHTDGGNWNGTKPYNCSLLDENGDELLVREWTPMGCKLAASDLSAGMHYVQVSNPTEDDHYYAATTALVAGTMLPEPNDDTTKANNITFAELTSGDVFFGDLPDDTDTDFMTFEVTSALAGDESLVLYPDAKSALKWSVENSSGTEVASGYMSAAQMEISSADLPPDTYYVKVEWASTWRGDSGVYSFYGAVEN